MTDFPILPFWVSDHLADARPLTTMEHGAYCFILFTCWRSPRCALPNDDAVLSRIAGLSIEDWNSIKSTVLAFFVVDRRRNEIRHEKLMKERSFIERKSCVNRNASLSRWNKKKKEHANALRSECERYAPTLTLTPTPIEERKEESPPLSPPRTAKRSVEIADPDFDRFWTVFPIKQGKSAARRAFVEAKKRAPPEAIIAGAERYRDEVRDCQDETRKWKWPQGWLNDDRWTDEGNEFEKPNGYGKSSGSGRIITNLVRAGQMPSLADFSPGGRFAPERDDGGDDDEAKPLSRLPFR